MMGSRNQRPTFHLSSHDRNRTSSGDAQCLVLSCSSIVLSLFSIVVSLSSISLSILPSSSSRGPMYCPGLSGEGSGSIGLGRSGSGRLGRSNRGLVDPVGFFVFRVFISQEHTF